MNTQENNKKANKLKASKMVNKLVDEYYDELVNINKTHNKLVCYSSGLAMTPFLAAQDIAWVHGEAYGARIVARKEQNEPQQYVEALGYQRDICSYARTQIGCCMMSEYGVPSGMKVGPVVGEIPRPDLIVTCYPACSSGAQWDWAIERTYGKKIPWYNVVVPYRIGRTGLGQTDGEEYQEQVKYVADQFKGLIRFLEEVSGRPFNWDKFQELTAYTKKVATLRNEALEICKKKPSPASYFDWAIFISVVNYLTAWPGSLEAMEAAKAEVQERAENNVSSIPNEKYRLYWEGIMNWGKIGFLADKFAKYDACVVAGSYTHLGFWPVPHLMDPENPLEAIAKNHLLCPVNMRFPVFEHETMKLMSDYSIDGVLLHGARTCRAFSRFHYLIGESLSRKMDISSVMFEGDMTDETFYNNEVIDTRIEALLESLAAKKIRK